MVRDVDIDVSWLIPFKLWRMADEDTCRRLPPASASEKHLDDLVESRCIEMELITYGCLDAKLS